MMNNKTNSILSKIYIVNIYTYICIYMYNQSELILRDEILMSAVLHYIFSSVSLP